MEKFDQLVEIMRRLRNPEGGCPWDLKQDHQSIAKYTIEEAYEVVDAIENGGPDELKDELGDLLLQVVFHAQMASEKNNFSIHDVVDAINGKMVERHPHVFDEKNTLTPEQVESQWEEIKNKGKKKKLLDSVPKSFPALMKSYEIGKKCAKVGFDWDTKEQIKEKMDEEWAELIQGFEKNDQKNIEEELGDFLFVTAQYIRKIGLNPESVLQKANQKFIKRLHAVEDKARDTIGREMKDCSVDELEAYWEEVKSD